jgi:hypothetical protein
MVNNNPNIFYSHSNLTVVCYVHLQNYQAIMQAGAAEGVTSFKWNLSRRMTRLHMAKPAPINFF